MPHLDLSPQPVLALLRACRRFLKFVNFKLTLPVARLMRARVIKTLINGANTPLVELTGGLEPMACLMHATNDNNNTTHLDFSY